LRNPVIAGGFHSFQLIVFIEYWHVFARTLAATASDHAFSKKSENLAGASDHVWSLDELIGLLRILLQMNAVRWLANVDGKWRVRIGVALFWPEKFSKKWRPSTYRWLAVVIILCGFWVAFGNPIMKAFSE
jgi:hypothetical protein